VELATEWGDGGLLVAGRRCLSVVFTVNASSKFPQMHDEVKILSNLHLPAPAMAELRVGVFETIGVIVLAFGIYARLAAIFMVVASFAVLSFWSPRPAAGASSKAQRLCCQHRDRGRTHSSTWSSSDPSIFVRAIAMFRLPTSSRHG
jgi:uncharacterized membrane protein YphA (DoxX/SURF4 family)